MIIPTKKSWLWLGADRQIPIVLIDKNLTKECDCMKGIKIGVVGVCVSLLGIAFAMNNFIAICGASIGLLLAFVGCFVKDK